MPEVEQTKVLLIAPQPFYEVRGTPMNVRLMCTILGQAGYLVDLLVLPTGKDVDIPGVRIIRLPNILGVQHIPIGVSWKKMFFDALLPLWCMGLCLKNKYKVIHGIEEGGILAVALGCLGKKSASIFDMDSLMSEQFPPRGVLSSVRIIMRSLERWSMRNAAVVLTVCEALSKKARAVAPDTPLAQIEDIPLEFAFPVEKGIKKQSIQNVALQIEQFGLQDKRLLLYTGNLQGYQGIDLLLESWKLFCTKCNRDDQYRLVVVGGPQQKADNYITELEKSTLQNSVVFVGPRPLEEMEPWMDAAHALVSPRSDGENTPLKVYTYMASGKPIVATRMLTHTQVLSDDIAFLAAPNAVDMAEALYQALVDTEQGRKKGKAARLVVEEQFSFDAFAQKLLHTYGVALRTIKDK